MKRYIRSATTDVTELDLFRYEAKLCKFMRDNYGLSCSVNNTNHVCNLSTDDKLASVVCSPNYTEITTKDKFAQDGVPSGLVSLYVPYDMPLNDNTAQQIIDCLAFTDDENTIRNAEQDRIDKLIADNKVMNQGNYVVAVIKSKLGIKPASKYTGTPRWSMFKYTMLSYKVDSATASNITKICTSIMSDIRQVKDPRNLHNIEYELVESGVDISIKEPYAKMIVDPKTLEIIEILY